MLTKKDEPLGLAQKLQRLQVNTCTGRRVIATKVHIVRRRLAWSWHLRECYSPPSMQDVVMHVTSR